MSKPPGWTERNTLGESTLSTEKTPTTPQPSNYSWYQGTSPSSATTVTTMTEPASTASPDAVYQEIFGTYTPETILNTKIIEYSMTGEDFSNEPEWIRKELEKKVTDYSDTVSATDKEKIKEYSEKVISGEAEQTTLFEDFNEPYTEARSNVSSESIATKINQGEEYMTPTSLSEAKAVADRVYMDTLKHRLTLEEEGSEEYARIEKAIKFGPQDFSNPSFAYSQLGLGFNTSNYSPAIEEAARFQAATVKNYLVSNNIPLYQEVDYERIDGGKVYLNTGTALHLFEEDAPYGNPSLGHGYHVTGGDLGSYSAYEIAPPPKESNNPFKNILNVAATVLSVMYPQSAPLLQGVNTLVQGGDFEDALLAAGKAYIGGKIAEATTAEFNEFLTDSFADLGFDITNLPVPAQNVILDTSRAVLQGESGTEAFKESVTGEILDSIDIDIDVPDLDFDTPELIEQLGDAIYAGVKKAGDIAEEGYKAVEPILTPVGDLFEGAVDLTADVFEPVVDIVDEGLDYFGETVVDPTLQTGSDVLSEFDDTVLQPVKEGVQAVTEPVIETAQEVGRDIDEEIIQPTLDVVQEVTEPVVDVIDDIIDAVDSPIGDILQAGGNLIQGMLGGVVGGQQPQTVSRTPVENIFNKELFKFDTEIKSTQEMLSPMMNLRRYG